MAKGKKVTGEKRKWLAEYFNLENPRPMDPISFMAASRELARAEQANGLQRERGSHPSGQHRSERWLQS